MLENKIIITAIILLLLYINGVQLCILLDPLIYYYSNFGEGNGLPVWSYVHCNGWEDSIHDCTKSVLPNFNCANNYVAGVTCKQSKTKQSIHACIKNELR